MIMEAHICGNGQATMFYSCDLLFFAL